MQISLQNDGLVSGAAKRLLHTSAAFATSEIVSILHTFTKMRYTPAKKLGVYQAGLKTLLSPERSHELNTQVRRHTHVGVVCRCSDA